MVIADRNVDVMRAHFRQQGNWHCLQYEEAPYLIRKFDVQGIPSMVAIDAMTGLLITKHARGTVEKYKENALSQWINQIQ